MMDTAVLLDSAIVAYALGEPSELRDECRALMKLIAEDQLRAYASVEMIQEVVHHRLRRTGDRTRAASDARDTSTVLTLLNFDREVLDVSLRLIERGPHIRGRDAVHAATALVYGIPTVVSTDRSFDGVPGLTRVEPRALL